MTAMAHKPYAVASTISTLTEMYWDDAQAFAEDILDMDPDDWQQAVFHDISHFSKVSVRSGQGVGKTALEAACLLWFICTRPNCRIVATAPTRQQLNDVLWAEVKKWINRSPIIKVLLVHTATKIYMRGRKETWFATAKTATKPENMQGYHEDYMLFIVDEASGIADAIMEAILGTLTGEDNKLLMCGNPNRTSGTFYDSHHRDRDKYKTHHVNSLNSRRTSKENIEMLIRKYGKESNVVRVRVFGEFPNAEPDVFIPLEYATTATEVEVLEDGKHTGQIYLGVDCARFGDDEIIVYPRIGPYTFEPFVYHKLRTTELAGHIKRIGEEMCHKFQRTLVNVNIDVGAMGAGVVDDLLEATRDSRIQWAISEVPFGGAGDDDCDDMATVMYKVLRDLFEEGQIRIPNDDVTIAQMSTRKYRVTVKGKLKLESKDDYKKRHEESPDRADALALAFYEGGVDGKYITTTRELESKQRSVRPSMAGIRNKRF